MKRESIRLRKNKASLTEYSDGTLASDNKLFLQSGIAGFFLSRKELEDINTIVNYYLNIDQFSDCYVEIENEIFPVMPTGE
jgi:hypothetical protein